MLNLKKQMQLFPFILILAVSLVLTIAFHFVNEAWETSDFQSSVVQRHSNFITCENPSLFCYRILVPYSIEYLHNFSNIPLLYCYDIYHLIFLFLALIFFLKFLQNFLPFPYALAGVFLFSSIYPITFNIIDATDMFVLFIFSFSNYLLISNYKFRNHLLLLAIFIGTFAKDITLFILFAFILFNYFDYKKQKDNSKIFWSTGAVICFIIPYLLLRFTFGFFPYEFTIMHNLYAFKAIAIFLIFIGIPAFLALYDFKSKPLPIKILTLVFSIYTILLLFVGNIDETRIFIPILLILVPQVLMNLKKHFNE